MRLALIYFTIAVFLSSCNNSNSKVQRPSAQALLTLTTKAHGNNTSLNKQLTFHVENTQYKAFLKNQRTYFEMQRTVDSVNHRVLYRAGLIEYYKNDVLQKDDTYPYILIERSLYGFLYTYLIPFTLNTNDVRLKLLEDVQIRSKPYYTLDVSFSDTALVTDTNRFILYIDKENYTIDYMALSNSMVGNQVQFRRFTNPRRVDDILFYDYYIFASQEDSVDLEQLYKGYNNAILRDTRHIEIKNPTTAPIPTNYEYK